MQMFIDSFLVQPIRKSLLFPVCAPGLCAKCRSVEPSKEDGKEDPQSQTDREDPSAGYVVENPIVLGIETLNVANKA
jgi:hypothetical protein